MPAAPLKAPAPAATLATLSPAALSPSSACSVMELPSANWMLAKQVIVKATSVSLAMGACIAISVRGKQPLIGEQLPAQRSKGSACRQGNHPASPYKRCSPAGHQNISADACPAGSAHPAHKHNPAHLHAHESLLSQGLPSQLGVVVRWVRPC